MITLVAYNVHTGGGATLLLDLIERLPKGSCLFLDQRFLNKCGSLDEFDVCVVRSTLFFRIKAEVLLRKKCDGIVLCFGNLPPLFRLDSKVFLFIQNRHLISEPLNNVSWKLWIKLSIERLWLRWFCKNAQVILVQTRSMQCLAQNSLNRPVHVLGFVELPNIVGHKSGAADFDFIYVASGEEHKNHTVLLKAWKLLAESGFYPRLCLTVNPLLFPKLIEHIHVLNETHNTKIHNVGVVSKKQIYDLYHKSKALVYPSKLESFGLPLIEAHRAGLSIIASELDYVRDILDPEESFDPESATSVARAICRFKGYKCEDRFILSPSEFINKILELK